MRDCPNVHGPHDGARPSTLEANAMTTSSSARVIVWPPAESSGQSDEAPRAVSSMGTSSEPILRIEVKGPETGLPRSWTIYHDDTDATYWVELLKNSRWRKYV